MTTLRTAAQQALEALEGGADSWQRVGPAIDALKAALAEEAMQRLTDVQQEIEDALVQETEQFDHGIGDDRFKVVRGAYWWHVLIGDGTKKYGKFHTQSGAEEMAALLLREFKNGAFVQHRAALAEPEQPTMTPKELAASIKRGEKWKVAEPQTTHWEGCSAVHPECAKAEAERIRAAMQRLTDVQQEMERNFCPRCGKRTNDIHTCTPPHEEHFCDTHCTWADHAPGCVRAEPVQEPVAIVEQLWSIIDDIDTYTDMAKADDKLYRSLVERRQADRWKTGITTDGYTLNIPSCSAPTPRKPLTEEEILKAVGWDRAEMYMKLTPNFPVAEAKKETLKNARAIERAHGIGGQT